MPKKLPAIMFFTGDWLKDPAVRACDLDARGLWIDMLCLMNESPRRGYLCIKENEPMPIKALARIVGQSTRKVSRIITDLENAGVFSRETSTEIIFSRRLVLDENIRQVKSKAGKKGMRSRYGDGSRPDSVITEVVDSVITGDITPLEYEYEDETDTNKERKQKTNPPQVFNDRSGFQNALDAIPKNRQRGIGRFRKAWIAEIVGLIDESMVCQKLESYYRSPEGRGEYHRTPLRLIEDEFWNEDQSVWVSRDSEESEAQKFPTSPTQQEKIINDYCKLHDGARERIDEQISDHNQEVGYNDDSLVRKIAYRIWKSDNHKQGVPCG